ncbi:MAG: site-specific DNA-methyltransferase [Clostridia bacterium]|nr:site-specific DNA-methyltransferase [Clostridia bacterium]
MGNTIKMSKEDLLREIDRRVEDKIIEKSNAELLKKLIRNAETLTEAIAIAELGTTYKRTGLHFDKRLEKNGNTIKYFVKNENLSFTDGTDRPHHKLIIGDNYDSLTNLLIEYRGGVDVIYIDPPYGKDSMGEFAKTNYENALTRDNLLSMLYPRLLLARELLSADGVIFCSIDDRNQSYIKCLFDEVFGESSFLFCVPRITKKGGKTTDTIQKNNDYVIAYTLSRDIIFNQLEKDMSSFDQEDEYVEERGKFKVTQPLDYGSLSYSPSLDYPLEYNGKVYYPGGDKNAWEERQKGNYRQSDWAWRWSKSAVEWGIQNDVIVLKGDRIYTKTYSKCRKKTGINEFEFVDATKPYTTLSFLENEFSNDNGKKELDKIFPNGEELFKNPKPSVLIAELINMVCPKKDSVILDFFAGSGSTAHAVLALNKNEDNRTFILCQLNEITQENPNGIAYDVTSKRLKRIMTGECYDGSKDFKWASNEETFNGSLDVYEIATVANFENAPKQTPFDVIDETLYGKDKFSNLKEKIQWVCNNFEITQKMLESDSEWKTRLEDNQ